jgi:hypothetical protein
MQPATVRSAPSGADSTHREALNLIFMVFIAIRLASPIRIRTAIATAPNLGENGFGLEVFAEQLGAFRVHLCNRALPWASTNVTPLRSTQSRRPRNFGSKLLQHWSSTATQGPSNLPSSRSTRLAAVCR